MTRLSHDMFLANAAAGNYNAGFAPSGGVAPVNSQFTVLVPAYRYSGTAIQTDQANQPPAQGSGSQTGQGQSPASTPPALDYEETIKQQELARKQQEQQSKAYYKGIEGRIKGFSGRLHLKTAAMPIHSQFNTMYLDPTSPTGVNPYEWSENRPPAPSVQAPFSKTFFDSKTSPTLANLERIILGGLYAPLLNRVKAYGLLNSPYRDSIYSGSMARAAERFMARNGPPKGFIHRNLARLGGLLAGKALGTNPDVSADIIGQQLSSIAPALDLGVNPEIPPFVPYDGSFQ